MLFRILPDGGSDVIWRSDTTVGFGLKPLADGRVLIGTGSKGRIYQVGADRSHTLLIQSPEDQTSTIIAVGDSLYATSSNLGRLYRIGRDSVTEGTYVSPVRDTKFAGQWGAINWRGAGSVQIQTRTGNTETPDLTWSEWSAPYTQMSGEPISSPRARRPTSRSIHSASRHTQRLCTAPWWTMPPRSSTTRWTTPEHRCGLDSRSSD